MKKLILILFIMFLIVPAIYAKQGHLKLLAVKETEGGQDGTIADLYLEIKPGSGRVFLDTFPLTKIDTQVSTRFAKAIACSYLEKDCLKYDFIYTIRANSPIIAGPSAGGAITLLTIALLDDVELDEKISITGTINSGGIIGPVGGIKEKIDAADDAGINKVLIPEGERFIEEDIQIIETITMVKGNKSILKNASIKNKTIDLVEYGKRKGLDVVEVSNINEALHEFTGREFENHEYNLIMNKGYRKTMAYLASQLCNRSDRLLEKAGRYDAEHNETIKAVLNLTGRAKISVNKSRYYSAASYCFGANVKLTYLMFSSDNLSKEDVYEVIGRNSRNIDRLEKSIDNRKKKTITDLEAYAVIKERLIESNDYNKNVPEQNMTGPDLYNLAYSTERVYSAFSWANFFDHRGKQFDFNKKAMESSCGDKIKEAEERYNYALLFYPALDLSGTRKEIDYAYDDMNNSNYELCLFKATKAKAESDVILSVSGVGADKADGLVDKKLEAAKKNIAKQVDKGNFPILAYSYYEYADELKEEDRYSALLYAEYALELSNLDMYFEEVKIAFVPGIDLKPVILVIFGALIGYLFSKAPKRNKNKRPKNPIRI